MIFSISSKTIKLMNTQKISKWSQYWKIWKRRLRKLKRKKIGDRGKPKEYSKDRKEENKNKLKIKNRMIKLLILAVTPKLDLWQAKKPKVYIIIFRKYIGFEKKKIRGARMG